MTFNEKGAQAPLFLIVIVLWNLSTFGNNKNFKPLTKMKPKVFLSHNKKDKEFIVKLANDLRSCGIDVWYDEWEIPPGDSLRKKIFEEGITSCDLFFVYLTENSINSKWVQQELDAAFVQEIELNSSFLLVFVDDEALRGKLSIDLKRLSIPVFNFKDYVVPFGKILSKVWTVFMKRKLEELRKENIIKYLELENKYLQLKQNSSLDFGKIKDSLSSKAFKFDGKTLSLLELLTILRNVLASGCQEYTVIETVINYFSPAEEDFYLPSTRYEIESRFSVSDFMGEAILNGLVEMTISEHYGKLYTLNKEGIEFLRNK